MTSKIEEVIAARQGMYLRKDIYGNQVEVWAIPYERAKQIVAELEAALAECERKLACYGNMPVVLLETEAKLAAAREAVAANVEATCKEWCHFCNDNYSVKRLDNGLWIHTELRQVACYAARIRERFYLLAALTEAGEQP